MKRIIFLVLSLLLLISLFTPDTVRANGAGLPPFFRINGKLSLPNPLQIFGITSSSFLIPQDFAPENYLANTPIDFDIDSNQLESVIVGASLKEIKYNWDFGDGSATTGTKNTHTYTKPGSYILTLFINIYYQETPTPTQFIDTYIINILPDKNYQGLPKAVIKINGSDVGNPLKTNFEVNLSNPISFDGSESKDASSKIVEYLWNFGDGQTGSGQEATHQYSKPYNTAVSSYGIAYDEIAVLRVKDSSGFFSDAFIGLRHNPNAKNNPVSNSSNGKSLIKKNNSNFPLISIFILIIISLIIFILFIVKAKRKN